MLAITVSSEFSKGVSHLTNAKDVNENTKVIQAAAASEGVNKGSQRILNLPKALFPLGNNFNWSSKFRFNVERTGSVNRITKAILNQAWAMINVQK
jgi:hypothetical protein